MIRRYSLTGQPEANGEFVTYEDHFAALERYDTWRIEALEEKNEVLALLKEQVQVLTNIVALLKSKNEELNDHILELGERE